MISADSLTAQALESLPDLGRLVDFHEVSHAKSLREAALRQGVSQSAISRSISSLEKDLGLVLLERSRTGITLTEHGKALLARVEAVLSAVSQAQGKVRALKNLAAGTVRLALPATLSSFLLPPLFGLYAAELTKTNISILEGSARHIHQWLKMGEVDIGIIVGPSQDRQISAELLYVENLYFMCRSLPDGMDPHALPFRQLADMQLVLPLMPLGSRQILESMAEQQGVRLNPLVEVDSPSIQKLLVLRHGLCGVFSRLVCQDEIEAGLIHAIPITPAPQRSFYIATREGGASTPATRLLAHLLRRVALGLNHLKSN